MKLPFDGDKLNALMEEVGVDLVLATSKHNVQYLFGGYRFFFFAHMDAIGMSRYLPALGLPRGNLEKSFYVGNTMEVWQQAVEPLWVQNVRNDSWTSATTAGAAAQSIRKLGLEKGAIAVEHAFIPADALSLLQEELPDAKWVEALPILEELRAVKAPQELAILKEASEAIVDSMLVVMRDTPAGTATRDIANRMRQEEVKRGLNFEYCLACSGPSFNRAPSDARWEKGYILSLDSGGNKEGYIGDLCRMAVLGKPTALMQDLLAEVRAIQDAARTAIRAGAVGGEIYEKAQAERAGCAHKDEIVFTAHGMGLVSHEAPHLTSTGVVPYPGTHENRPLEAGMVISIETDMKNPEVGFVKLEDTVVVTENGWEAYGDDGRDWVVAEG